MISAIVPFRDWSIDRLEVCLACLRQYRLVTEIILVDFGSSVPLACPPGCRLVRVEADRWCLSEANNIGIAEAANPLVMKIDADVQLRISEDVLAELADALCSGSVSFYVLPATDFDDRDGEAILKRLRPNWGEGCCNLFNRSDVIEIGGFDTRFFDYGGEDNDLCQRLRRYGKRVEYHQCDQVLHERHPPSDARTRGRFTDAHKKALLADQSVFRRRPFRYSNYHDAGVFGPAITVAIATTDRPNRAAHLADCLAGLTAQTVQDFEVRICDNGSPKDARLKQAALRKAFPALDIYVHTQSDASIPKARNLITAKARGFYIAVHDDDDISLPTRFEEQLDCMARAAHAHGCHGAWIEFDEANGHLTSYFGQERDINSLMRRQGKVSLHGTGFYRRDVLARFRYDETLVLSSDHDLHTRMTLAGLRVAHTGRFQYLRRLHRASVSTTGAATQRGTSDKANRAYKYFVGVPFLAGVRAERDEVPWVSGFPSLREMYAHLPKDFGAFRIDLDLEAALALGWDPIFTAPETAGRRDVEGLAFEPAYRGYGEDTLLVMRTCVALTAGEISQRLPAFANLRGVDVVPDKALASDTVPVSLDALRVEKGQRMVISQRHGTVADALAALPKTVLAAGLGQIGFFAVSEPEEGVHVRLGPFDTVNDLEFALNVANAGGAGQFFAVSDQGRRGSFHGP